MKIEFKRESKTTGKMLAYELEKIFKFFKVYRVYEEIKDKNEFMYKYLYKTTIS